MKADEDEDDEDDSWAQLQRQAALLPLAHRTLVLWTLPCRRRTLSSPPTERSTHENTRPRHLPGPRLHPPLLCPGACRYLPGEGGGAGQRPRLRGCLREG